MFTKEEIDLVVKTAKEVCFNILRMLVLFFPTILLVFALSFTVDHYETEMLKYAEVESIYSFNNAAMILYVLAVLPVSTLYRKISPIAWSVLTIIFFSFTFSNSMDIKMDLYLKTIDISDPTIFISCLVHWGLIIISVFQIAQQAWLNKLLGFGNMNYNMPKKGGRK